MARNVREDTQGDKIRSGAVCHHTQARAHTHTHTQSLIYAHALLENNRTHAHTHTHAQRRTETHTHTHTHTHTSHGICNVETQSESLERGTNVYFLFLTCLVEH